MRKFILVLCLALLMSVSVPSMAAEQKVIAVGLTFVPATVVASSTDQITLLNKEVAFIPHNLTVLNRTFCVNENCSTENVNPGGSGSFTLDRAPVGAYPFVCTIHPNMRGLLVVR